MESTTLRKMDYGQIVLHLRKFMDERDINRNQLAKATGADFAVIDRWYQGTVERLDLDILARVCYVLDCRVEEILTYEKP